jgi:uncharacterized protein
MSHAVRSVAPGLAPVATRERILTLDVLRGIALLGVLTANVWMWFSGMTFNSATQQAGWGVVDKIVHQSMLMFVQWKSFGVFSFLFGLGFGVQLLRAEERGHSIVPVYSRRLLVLLGLGVLHMVFIWYGDILSAYAILGFLLLLFRRASDRVLLASAVIAFGMVVALFTLPGHPSPDGGAAISLAARAELFAQILAGFQSGSYAEIFRANQQMLGASGSGTPPWFFPAVLLYEFGFFLLGLWAARWRIFERVSEHRVLLGRIVRVALPVAVVAQLLLLTLYPNQSTALGGVPTGFPMPISAAFAAVAYLAIATLLLEHDRWRRWLGAFAPVGRMALTNYLAQSVICIAIFYGGGLVGRTGPAASVAIACAIFAVQMVYSRWWLAHYRFGPMEWVWRSLTYGRMQAMKHPVLLLAAALLGLTLPAAARAQDPMKAGLKPSPPPIAPVRPVVDDYHGTMIVDPYRNMENLEDPEVQAWLKAQADYTRVGRDPARWAKNVAELVDSTHAPPYPASSLTSTRSPSQGGPY